MILEHIWLRIWSWAMWASLSRAYQLVLVCLFVCLFVFLTKMGWLWLGLKWLIGYSKRIPKHGTMSKAFFWKMNLFPRSENVSDSIIMGKRKCVFSCLMAATARYTDHKHFSALKIVRGDVLQEENMADQNDQNPPPLLLFPASGELAPDAFRPVPVTASLFPQGIFIKIKCSMNTSCTCMGEPKAYRVVVGAEFNSRVIDNVYFFYVVTHQILYEKSLLWFAFTIVRKS